MKVAVIPARGGSKRIPRKNIREFGGKPMIAWSIECALRSGLFDRIIVSTDDEEIAAVARQHGAEVPFMRPPDIANDFTLIAPVLEHAVRWLFESGARPLAVCCLFPTAPLMDVDDLRRGGELLAATDKLFVFPATTYAYPIFRSFYLDADGGPTMVFPDRYAQRSQDLPEALHDAGQFYWGRPEAWLEQRPVFAAHSVAMLIPRWRVQDLDTEEDWTRAEFIARYVRERAVAQASKN